MAGRAKLENAQASLVGGAGTHTIRARLRMLRANTLVAGDSKTFLIAPGGVAIVPTLEVVDAGLLPGDAVHAEVLFDRMIPTPQQDGVFVGPASDYVIAGAVYSGRLVATPDDWSALRTPTSTRGLRFTGEVENNGNARTSYRVITELYFVNEFGEGPFLVANGEQTYYYDNLVPGIYSIDVRTNPSRGSEISSFNSYLMRVRLSRVVPVTHGQIADYPTLQGPSFTF